MAFTNQNYEGHYGGNALDTTQKIDGKGAFGGAVKFVVTKGVSAAGPTWTLTHFKGPGGLGSFSRLNTDSLTIAFAKHTASGSGAGKKTTSGNEEAHDLVVLIINNSISSGITILNAPH
jgi:hypothetical protein